jgi:hypothetical protein
MSERLQRRLPGVRFDVPAPLLAEALPRMDIALFVGFAASGPIDLPVALESLAEFEAVFGAEITLLARDDGTPVGGLLHPALRQFFSHGGRRAWVVRVAGAAAETSRFALQQTLALTAAAGGWRVEPAFADARCPGSWADALSVATEVERQVLPVRVLAHATDSVAVQAFGALALALAPGDLLRLPLGADLGADSWLHGVVARAEVPAVAADGRLARRLELAQLSTMHALAGAPLLDTLAWFDAAGEHVAPASGTWLPDARLAATARLPAATRVVAGELLHLRFGDGRSGWLVIDEIEATLVAADDGQVDLRAAGAVWHVPPDARLDALAPWLAAQDERAAVWLRAALRVAGPGTREQRNEGLGYAARDDGAPSLATLPDDAHFFAERGRARPGERAVRAFELAERGAEPPATAPLAGRIALAARPGPALLLPLGHHVGFAAGAPARHGPRPALERDGLERFHWSLFAEPALEPLASDAVAGQAEALRTLERAPRGLRGMHHAFGSIVAGLADEPTLLVVPDAVQPGWLRRESPEPVWQEWPVEPEPLPPDLGAFDNCDRTPLAAPHWLRSAEPDAEGHFVLRWAGAEPALGFELQEAADRAFTVASSIEVGSNASAAIVGKPRGSHFFRVRARSGLRLSPWSATLQVRVGSAVYAVAPWRADDLAALHRLMLRTAAGRGDMLAVLALPRHYRWADAVAHAGALRRDLAGEPRALSHGALVHPWLHTRRDTRLVTCPPDGAWTGQLAASALARGAWIAVAEQPLRDVVAIDLPPRDDERQALLEAQVNPVRSSPRGFVLGSAETLIDDADWRAVNVRRLMSLLRRAALRRGASYVFEPLGPPLRRTVERAFEALLEMLFRRGALAGARAEQAFRVVVGEEVNTRQRGDAGQFWIELRVAPALPLTWLTVRLVRSGERLVAEEMS